MPWDHTTFGGRTTHSIDLHRADYPLVLSVNGRSGEGERVREVPLVQGKSRAHVESPAKKGFFGYFFIFYFFGIFISFALPNTCSTKWFILFSIEHRLEEEKIYTVFYSNAFYLIWFYFIFLISLTGSLLQADKWTGASGYHLRFNPCICRVLD